MPRHFQCDHRVPVLANGVGKIGYDTYVSSVLDRHGIGGDGEIVIVAYTVFVEHPLGFVLLVVARDSPVHQAAFFGMKMAAITKDHVLAGDPGVTAGCGGEGADRAGFKLDGCQ